jgi:hypothetical protein
MKKWRAQFGYGGKCRNLGYFDDPADAVTQLLLHSLCVSFLTQRQLAQ